MKYLFHNTLFIIVEKLVKFSSKKKLILFSNILASIFFKLIKIRREVVFSNLRIAFPLLDAKEIYEIAYATYKSIALTFIEFVKAKSVSGNFILDEVEFENKEIFEEILNQKKSLILLTAHFGNWEYGALAIGLKYNFSMSVLAKRQSNEFVTNFMSDIRTRFGNKEIFTGSSVKELYKALLEKEIIGVVGDQRGSIDGPRVKFFGKETAVYTGTASLALKTQTPILVILVARQKNNKYKAIIEKLSLENLPEQQEEKLLEINQRYFNILEKTIKKYPEQWFWMHKIWKY